MNDDRVHCVVCDASMLRGSSKRHIGSLKHQEQLYFCENNSEFPSEWLHSPLQPMEKRARHCSEQDSASPGPSPSLDEQLTEDYHISDLGADQAGLEDAGVSHEDDGSASEASLDSIESASALLGDYAHASSHDVLPAMSDEFEDFDSGPDSPIDASAEDHFENSWELECFRLLVQKERLDAQAIDSILRFLHQPGFQLGRLPSCYSQYRQTLKRRFRPQLSTSEHLVTIRRKVKKGRAKTIDSKVVHVHIASECRSHVAWSAGSLCITIHLDFCALCTPNHWQIIRLCFSFGCWLADAT